MEDKKSSPKKPHNLILEDRKKMSVCGVEDMDSFDEQTIVLYTQMGELTIKGGDLRMSKLSLDTGEVEIEGDFHSFYYTEAHPVGQGLIKRLFKG